METDSIISLIAGINQQARKLIVRELKANDVDGIASSHGDILANLFSRGPLCQTELATMIRREKNTTTVLLNKLEKHGYVSRSTCETDKRKTIIELTEKGLSLEPVFRKISTQLIETSYMNFSEEEKLVIMGLLTRIKQNLN